MLITDKLLTSYKARPRTKRSRTTKIAIHWVGNANSSAIANRNYFNNGSVSASSHYIVGLQGEIIRCVPDDEIAYTTNSANAYSIGIENCHPDWTGKFNHATYNSLVELCAMLCKKYNLNPINDLIRHYDVTKKVCPKYFVDHPDEWDRFKQAVKNKMNGVNSEQAVQGEFKNGTYNQNFKVVSPDGVLSVRDARPVNGNLGNKLGELKSGDVFKGGYCLNNWMGLIFNGKQGFVNGEYITFDRVEIPSYSRPWKNGDYKGAQFRVTADVLNVRKGRPGQSNYNNIVAKLKQNQVVELHYCLDGWFSVYVPGANPGFISGDYVEFIK